MIFCFVFKNNLVLHTSFPPSAVAAAAEAVARTTTVNFNLPLRVIELLHLSYDDNVGSSLR